MNYHTSTSTRDVLGACGDPKTNSAQLIYWRLMSWRGLLQRRFGKYVSWFCVVWFMTICSKDWKECGTKLVCVCSSICGCMLGRYPDTSLSLRPINFPEKVISRVTDIRGRYSQSLKPAFSRKTPEIRVIGRTPTATTRDDEIHIVRLQQIISILVWSLLFKEHSIGYSVGWAEALWGSKSRSIL